MHVHFRSPRHVMSSGAAPAQHGYRQMSQVWKRESGFALTQINGDATNRDQDRPSPSRRRTSPRAEPAASSRYQGVSPCRCLKRS
ncbi:hypothetical protein MYA_1699 [Burkholderia sp. KJ006]|nr:hypothetical protein MYA_1699 [Burkholderia sp. KJ006]CAG9188096.1 conserved hypothetical protein [Burkholderia vietnamiensis]